MFGKGNMTRKFTMLSEILDTGIIDDSLDGIAWKDLVKKGVVSETISSNDDGFTTIRRKFVSYDKTQKKEQTITMETKFFDQFIKDVDIKVVKEALKDLNEELENFEHAHAYEICAQVRDQILFLTERFKDRLDA